MDELIDVLTKDGYPTGKSEPKSVIHQRGLYHNTSHVWFYTKGGEVLLSQRSYKKAICPGMWDVSVAGHVDAHETVEDAAVRETCEELGISISTKELHKIGVFKSFQHYESGIADNEFHHTFICEFHGRAEQLQFHKEEVEGVKLVSLEEFFELLEKSSLNNHFVASNRFYYQIVVDCIKAKLKS